MNKVILNDISYYINYKNININYITDRYFEPQSKFFTLSIGVRIISGGHYEKTTYRFIEKYTISKIMIGRAKVAFYSIMEKFSK